MTRAVIAAPSDEARKEISAAIHKAIKVKDVRTEAELHIVLGKLYRGQIDNPTDKTTTPNLGSANFDEYKRDAEHLLTDAISQKVIEKISRSSFISFSIGFASSFIVALIIAIINKLF